MYPTRRNNSYRPAQTQGYGGGYGGDMGGYYPNQPEYPAKTKYWPREALEGYANDSSGDSDSDSDDSESTYCSQRSRPYSYGYSQRKAKKSKGFGKL